MALKNMFPVTETRVLSARGKEFISKLKTWMWCVKENKCPWEPGKSW
jgi:hypothetical protein